MQYFAICSTLVRGAQISSLLSCLEVGRFAISSRQAAKLQILNISAASRKDSHVIAKSHTAIHNKTVGDASRSCGAATSSTNNFRN